MDITAFSVDASHLLFGAFATFCAILLWSRTREMGWTFLIMAVIISYADIVLGTLRTYGILGTDLWWGRASRWCASCSRMCPSFSSA